MPRQLVEKVKKFLVDPKSFKIEYQEEDKEDEGYRWVDYEEFQTKWGAKFTKLMDRYLVGEEKRTGEAVLSPSMLGKCTRMLAYKYHDIEGEPLTYETKMTFLTGELLELVFYMLAEAAGEPIHDIQKRVSSGNIEGSIDGRIGETVVDIKSMSDAAFSINLRNGMSDDFGYQTQLEFYKEGMESVNGAWIAINKNRGTIEVMDAPHKPYLTKLGREKKDRVMASTPQNLPPRDYDLETEKKTGLLKLAMQCKFCDYKKICWDITHSEPGWNNSITYYSRGPNHE